MLQIREVNNNSDLNKFIKFQWQLYKNDPYWVPPLIMDMKTRFNRKKNPFYEHAEVQPFIAVRDGKVVGRVVAIKNDNHNKTHNDKVGFFGFFESINNYEVTETLLNECKSWLQKRGMDTMRGPMNFDVNDLTPGFLFEGFGSSPYFEMPYNPPYYIDYMEKYGMQKAKDLLAHYFDAQREIPKKVVRISELVKQKHNITIRSINMKKLRSEIEIVKEIYNKAWEVNWGAIPLTDSEIDYLADNLKTGVVPELALFAFVDGKPAGLAIAIPNYNFIFQKMDGRIFPFGIFHYLFGKNKVSTGRQMMLGIVKEYRNRGIEAVFYEESVKRGRKLGYIGGELSWILEDNEMMNRGIRSIGGMPYKKYRIYEIGTGARH